MKKVFLTLSVPLSVMYAQVAPTIQWQNLIGGSSSDEFQYIHPTPDGGYICGGHSTSPVSGDKTEAPVGSSDYWVIKLNAAGSIQWQNTLGGSDMEAFAYIEPTSDGGYICGGSSLSNTSGDKTEMGMGGTDYWIVKLDATGNVQWENTIGGNADENLKVIQEVPGGGYICAGSSASSISSDKSENNIGSNDYWIVRLNASGAIIWDNTIGGTMNDQFGWMQVTPDGGCIIGGTSSSSDGDKTEAPIGATDYWILKLSSTGTIQWQNTIGGTGADYLTGIKTTADGGYIVGGYSNSPLSGDKAENAVGGFDEWIVKLNASGTITWQNTIGSNFDDFTQYVEQTPEGGYIVSGSSNCTVSGDLTVPSHGSYDHWVVKLNNTGSIMWQTALGGSNIDYVPVIHKTTDGGFILGSYTFSSASGNIVETSNGSTDFWIVKLTPECFYPVIDSLVFTNTSTCAGVTDTLLIYGNLYDAAYWNITTGSCNGAMVDTTSASFAGINAFSSATYYVNGTGGCVSGTTCSTVSLTVNPLPATQAGNDTLVCGGSSVVLQATGASTYQWAGLPAGNLQTVVPAQTDTFIVTGFTNLGCSLTDSMIVTVSTIPEVMFSLPDSLCSGSGSLPLVATPPGGVFSGPGVNFNHFNPASVASGTHTLQYVYTNTDGCTATVADSVFVGITPALTVSNDTLICNGSSAVVEAYGADSYAWTGLSAANPQTVSPATSTFYTVVGTSNTGCTRTDSVLVTVSTQAPPFFVMDNDTLCISYAPFVLNALPGGGTYSGTGVSGNQFSPSNAGIGSHTLTYTVSNAFGCTASDTYVLTVISCIGIEEQPGLNVQTGPNPFNEYIVLYSDNPLIKAELLDVNGKMLLSVPVYSTPVYISTVALPAGMYVLVVTGADGLFVQKLIK